jgi:predicted 2-oxoglutarate/Fe(II)-dependent dioxygenase YbiX
MPAPTPPLVQGDPAPVFVARTAANPKYEFDTVAGRYVVLCIAASAAGLAPLAAAIKKRTDLFDDRHAAFFLAVPGEAADVADRVPGFRVFRDPARAIAALYARENASFVLDPALRVLAVIPLDDPARHAASVAAFVDRLPRRAPEGVAPPPPPILVVPAVFEPPFCRRLVAYFRDQGGRDSGFMVSDAAGRTVMKLDYGHKRRRDVVIDDGKLRDGVRARIVRRLLPEIAKAFQFRATRIERYIVACYDSGEGGYFRPHRDNTTKGTAHRRFAVTINLNAEDYEGGDLRFPEYDMRCYRAPTGGAVVFSCSIQHEATPVTKGQRYAVLPFLYDEAAAAEREANLDHLADPALRAAARAGNDKGPAG